MEKASPAGDRAKLSFTVDDWSMLQTVAVSAADDTDAARRRNRRMLAMRLSFPIFVVCLLSVLTIGVFGGL